MEKNVFVILLLLSFINAAEAVKKTENKSIFTTTNRIKKYLNKHFCDSHSYCGFSHYIGEYGNAKNKKCVLAKKYTSCPGKSVGNSCYTSSSYCVGDKIPK